MVSTTTEYAMTLTVKKYAPAAHPASRGECKLDRPARAESPTRVAAEAREGDKAGRPVRR